MNYENLDPGYYWFRNHSDTTTFIALRDENEDGWFLPGIFDPIDLIGVTLLGPVSRTVVGGGSIDQ